MATRKMQDSPSHPSLPRHSFNSPKRSGATPPDARLSIIAEDGDLPPRALPNTHHRPFSRRWNIGDPPRPSFETPPPKYTVWDVTGPRGEKLADVRNNKYIARRGGWRRICLIGFILIAVVIGLVVGLVVGLRNQHKSFKETYPAPPETPLSSSPLPTGPFPVGIYSFETFLANVSTNCVSKSTDWQCAPYHTYAESPPKSQLTFQWIITESDSSPSNFTISSPNNPFAIYFANTTLTLVDPGLETERYTYNTTFDKIVVTSLPVHCFFNNTLFEASLYTKRPKSYPPPDDASSSSNPPSPSSTPVPYADWNYAIDIKHSLGGGPNVPECYKVINGVKGDRVIDGRVPKRESERCSCNYRNHDP